MAGSEWHRSTWTRTRVTRQTSSAARPVTVAWRVAMKFHGSDWKESNVTRRWSRSLVSTSGTSRPHLTPCSTLRLGCCRRRPVSIGTPITPSAALTPPILSRDQSHSTTSVWHVSPFFRWRCAYCNSFILNKYNRVEPKIETEKHRTLFISVTKTRI